MRLGGAPPHPHAADLKMRHAPDEDCAANACKGCPLHDQRPEEAAKAPTAQSGTEEDVRLGRRRVGPGERLKKRIGPREGCDLHFHDRQRENPPQEIWESLQKVSNTTTKVTFAPYRNSDYCTFVVGDPQQGKSRNVDACWVTSMPKKKSRPEPERLLS